MRVYTPSELMQMSPQQLAELNDYYYLESINQQNEQAKAAKDQAKQQQTADYVSAVGQPAAALGGLYLASKLGSGATALGGATGTTGALAGSAGASTAGAGAASTVGATTAAGTGAATGTAAGTAAGTAGATGTGAATGSSLAGVGSVALPAAAAIAMALNAQQGYKDAKTQFGKGGKDKQTAVLRGGTSLFAPTGIATALGARPSDDVIKGINLLVGNPLAYADLAGINFFSGKSKKQAQRDQARKALQKSGILGDKFSLDFGDEKLDDFMSKDGGYRIPGTKRRAFELDNSDPTTSELLAFVDPLTSAMFGRKKNYDQQIAMSGQLVNALMQTKDPFANAKKLYEKAGVSKDDVISRVQELAQNNELSTEDRDAFTVGLNRVFDPKYQFKMPEKKAEQPKQPIANLMQQVKPDLLANTNQAVNMAAQNQPNQAILRFDPKNQKQQEELKKQVEQVKKYMK